MKEKFLHNSFFNYMRLINRGANATYLHKGKGAKEIILAAIAGVLLLLVFASLDSGSDGIFVCGALSWSIAIYFSCQICGAVRELRPSALRVAPIGYKKRTLYAYLSAFAYCLIFVICYIVFIMLIMLIISLFVLAFTGEWVFNISASAIVSNADPLGTVFAFFTFILTFGVGMLITYIKNKKLRYAAMFIFPAVLEVFALLLINFSYDGVGFKIEGDVIGNFQNLPLSWLWLTVYALITTVICAVSVYFAIKSEKPKEF